MKCKCGKPAPLSIKGEPLCWECWDKLPKGPSRIEAYYESRGLLEFYKARWKKDGGTWEE